MARYAITGFVCKWAIFARSMWNLKQVIDLASGTYEQDKYTTFCFTVPKAVPVFDVEMKCDFLETMDEAMK